MDVLLKMADGGIVDVKYDCESWNGCETCDFGSKYINEFDVVMTTGTIKVKVEQMYEYLLTEGFMIKLFLQNADDIQKFTEDEFFEWLKQQIEQEVERQGRNFSFPEITQIEFCK